MASPTGRRLRPLAVVCALLLVLWGLASAGSLIAQIMDLNDTGWPDENADGEIFGWIILYLSAAASGCWVAVWGLFGLAFRPPLHFAVLSLVVAVALEIVANVVQAGYIGEIDPRWSFGDQLGWYGDRVTFQADGVTGEAETRQFFIALPLVTASVPLAAWLIVIFSGAGRKRRPAPYAAAYPQQYAQPYPPQQYQQRYPQPQYPAQYQPQYPPQQYQQPAYQPPPQPTPQPPPQPRVPWQGVPPVVPPARPAPPPAKPPDQQETLPYRSPSADS